MTNVYTDQLAALPLLKVYIRLSASGMYDAAIGLEGRVLDIYESEGKPLQRPSLAAMRQCLLACGCPHSAFVVDEREDESQCQTLMPSPMYSLAAM